MMLLDTNVLIRISDYRMPDRRALLSAINLAELRFGVEHAKDARIRRHRQQHITRVETMFGSEWVPFDRAAAAGYGRMASIVSISRPRHARSNDIMLAGHAYALGAAIVTLNRKDFDLLEDELEIIVPALR